MPNSTQTQTVVFWVTLVAIAVYGFPLFASILAYPVSEEFNQPTFLYGWFVPTFAGTSSTYAAILTLLAPLGSGMTFTSSKHPRRLGAVLVMWALVLSAVLIVEAGLNQPQLIARVNAFLPADAPDLQRTAAAATLQGYQESSLAMILALLGLGAGTAMTRTSTPAEPGGSP